MDYFYYECEPYTEESSRWKYFFTPSFFVSFFLTLAISFIGSPILARMVFTSEKYPSTDKKQSLFTHILASNLHAVFTAAMGAYLLISGDLGYNLAQSKSNVGFTLLQVTLALYVAELITHLVDKDLRVGTETVIHHIGGILTISLVLFNQGTLMHIVCWRLMTHVPNLFNHPFYVLRTFNRKDSPLFTVVSVGMVIGGFITRVLPIIWFWKTTFTTIFLPCMTVAWPLRILGILLTILFDIYNLLLVYKMLKGCVKHLRRKMQKQI